MHRRIFFSVVVVAAVALSGCQSANEAPVASTPASTVAPAPAVPEPQPVDMAPQGSKPVSFQRVLITMESGATMGNVTGGWLNVHITTLKADPGEASKRFSFIGQEELKKAHYTIPGGDNQLFGEDASAKARFQIGAEIPNVHLDAHVQAGWSSSTLKSNGEMTVVWQVYDTLLQKVVFKKTITTPFHDQSKFDESNAPLLTMFRANLRALLAAQDFVAFMRPGAKSAEADTAPTESPLTISIGRKIEQAGLPAGFSTVLDSFVTLEPGAEMASGFIISSDGYVLTAAHVVSGIPTVPVRLHGGFVLEAKVVRMNEKADIALLKLPGSSFQPLALAAEVAAIGSDVYAIGNPAAKELNASISRGVISGIRDIDGRKFLQTDAAANPGSSGGPLLDKNGRVVGVISWKVAGADIQGLSFAVPSLEALARLNVKLSD